MATGSGQMERSWKQLSRQAKERKINKEKKENTDFLPTELTVHKQSLYYFPSKGAFLHSRITQTLYKQSVFPNYSLLYYLEKKKQEREGKKKKKTMVKLVHHMTSLGPTAPNPDLFDKKTDLDIKITI